MRRRTRNMPSASMVVAFTALLLALGGTAVALPGNNTVTSGDIKNGQVKTQDIRNGGVLTQDIRNNTVRTQDIRNGGVLGKDVRNGTLTGADVRNNTLTGADVDESTLATVPRAILAAGADTANRATRVDSVKTAGFKRVGTSASDPDPNAARDAATRVPLFSFGAFDFYGKCFADSDDDNVIGEVLIATRVDGSIFDSDNDSVEGNPLLDTATPEIDRQVLENSSGVDSSDIDHTHPPAIAYAPDGTAVVARASVATKNGDVPGGNGVYGAGDVCLFSGNVIG